ncbi:hypothetical protein KY339_05990 [Candidatus Woesearchaeota archaeon]|nr:hypothetical protein [Candidatus Woesearchaeota archaeon]
MPQREIYVDGLGLQYDGLFDLKELYDLIHDWAKENGYSEVGKKDKGAIHPAAKNVSTIIVLEKPFDDKTLKIDVTLDMEDLTEETVEVEKRKEKLLKGNVTMILNGFVISWREGRWEQKGIVFFIRAIIDKFIYKIERGKDIATLVRDARDLRSKVSAFLKIHKYKGT